METSTSSDYPRGLTFEQVWAAIQVSKEEFDRGIKASREDFDQGMKASRADFDKRMKEWDERLNKQLGRWGNRQGEIIEAMVLPNLISQFKSLGLGFTKISQDVEIKVDGVFITDIDLCLENSRMVMAVEIKTKPDVNDIKDHLERMDKLRSYADSEGDKRKYRGALGGMVFGESERKFALKCGFYIIGPSGNTFNVIAPAGVYSPREW